MATRIAFATHDGFPNLTDDDHLAVHALVKHDVRVDAALWNDPAVVWSKYSAVVIRSCWDYHLKPDEFRSWLDKLQKERVVLWNPYSVVRWNMEKTYLNDLHQKGIPVLASVWLAGGEKTNLENLMLQKSWRKAVVKPVISASANDTQIFTLDSAGHHQRDFQALLQKGGVIVQDFAREIQTDGEWSLMFFNKQYSHSVIKRPEEGDFRVQRDFGGTAHPVAAPLRLIDQAQSILDGIEDELLYARVDGIDRDGQLFLMELELIEPHLFFEMHSQAAESFATALVEKLSAKA